MVVRLSRLRTLTASFATFLFVGCGLSPAEHHDPDSGGENQSGTDGNTSGSGAPPSGNGSNGERPGSNTGDDATEGSGGTDGSSGAGGSSGAPGSADAEDSSEEPERPVGNPGDDFEPVGTNPFVVVSHDPFSTFAADVDTASYDVFLRDLGYGYLPQPASVRLEEFVNYFSYNYPTPAHDAEVPFTVTIDAAPHVMDRDTSVVRVGVQAKEPPPFEKKAANLVFLVDVSGSMSSVAKLPLVKAVLNETLDVLEPTDTVSIVTYASGTRVRLEPTPASDSGTIEAVINSLSAGGSTNGAGGLELAYEQAQAGWIEGGINHVLLCTDGDFNVGLSGDALVPFIEEKRRTGITLTVLGFGSGNLNDNMMEKVSNAGNGVYGVIANEEHAVDYVNNRMLATLTHVAKDVKLQVEFNPDHVFAYRLLGYENRVIADDAFRDDTVDAGEVGAGHRVTALYEVVHTGGSIPQADGAPEVDDGVPVDGIREIESSEFVRVKVRYKDVDATESDAAHEVVHYLSNVDVASSSSIGEADADLRWAVAVAAFAEILKESPYADATFLDAIQGVVAGAKGDDGYRAQFEQLLLQARGLLSAP